MTASPTLSPEARRRLRLRLAYAEARGLDAVAGEARAALVADARARWERGRLSPRANVRARARQALAAAVYHDEGGSLD